MGLILLSLCLREIFLEPSWSQGPLKGEAYTREVKRKKRVRKEHIFLINPNTFLLLRNYAFYIPY